MDVSIIFYVKPIFTVGFYSSAPQNRELSGEINVKKCIIEKSKKNIAKKTLSYFSQKQWKKPNKFAHDTIQ